MFPKKKTITITKAKKKANAAFSLYIRLKYSTSEMVTCYTCDIVKHYKQMQAGHGISGRSGGVLYMEEVVRPQCIGCNMFGGGKYARFTQKLIAEHGAQGYADLVMRANQETHYKVADYLQIEAKYKEKVSELTGGLH